MISISPIGIAQYLTPDALLQILCMLRRHAKVKHLRFLVPAELLLHIFVFSCLPDTPSLQGGSMSLKETALFVCRTRACLMRVCQTWKGVVVNNAIFWRWIVIDRVHDQPAAAAKLSCQPLGRIMEKPNQSAPCRLNIVILDTNCLPPNSVKDLSIFLHDAMPYCKTLYADVGAHSSADAEILSCSSPPCHVSELVMRAYQEGYEGVDAARKILHLANWPALTKLSLGGFVTPRLQGMNFSSSLITSLKLPPRMTIENIANLLSHSPLLQQLHAKEIVISHGCIRATLHDLSYLNISIWNEGPDLSHFFAPRLKTLIMDLHNDLPLELGSGQFPSLLSFALMDNRSSNSRFPYNPSNLSRILQAMPSVMSVCILSDIEFAGIHELLEQLTIQKGEGGFQYCPNLIHFWVCVDFVRDLGSMISSRSRLQAPFVVLASISESTDQFILNVPSLFDVGMLSDLVLDLRNHRCPIDPVRLDY